MSLHLFEAFGIELEYMIVSANDLSVVPVADRLLERAAHQICRGTPLPAEMRSTQDSSPGNQDLQEGQEPPSEAEFGDTGWSNELVMHVVEFKTARPTTNLEESEKAFVASVAEANRILDTMGARLLGTSAHPWMDPEHETRLWPYGSKEIYQAYDRIFGCRGHGWSNLQSMHINLPFANDEEFGRLHAAVRAVLPLLGTLCASSPIIDGRVSGFLDTRLDYYRKNQERIPLITAAVVPEPVYTETAYRESILAPIYRELALLDDEGTLEDEWVNSRGAIARFDRMAIEIRTMDLQECPAMDIAFAEATVRLIRLLCEERFAPLSVLKVLPTPLLSALFFDSMKEGGETIVEDPVLLRILGIHVPATMRGIWLRLLPTLFPEGTSRSEQLRERLSFALTRGSLAERILQNLDSPTRGFPLPPERLRTLYGKLANCLAENSPFDPKSA